MMLTRTAVLLLAAVALLLGVDAMHAVSGAAQTPTAAANLVANASFETPGDTIADAPAEWMAAAGWPNIYATGGSHSGEHHVESVLADGISGQGCVMADINWVSQRDIAVDPSKRYLLTFWTKALLRSPTAHEMPIAGLEFFNAQHALVGSGAVDRGPIDLSDWTPLSYVVGPGGLAWPGDTAYVRLNIGGAGWDSVASCEPGRIYATQALDDVSFAPVPLAAPNTGTGSARAYAGGGGSAGGWMWALFAAGGGISAAMLGLRGASRRRDVHERWP